MTKRTDTSDALVTALGVVIQNRRKELEMSQDELARMAGLHRTYVSEIERRSRNLSVKILVRLALALNTSPAQLMNLAEDIARKQSNNPGSEQQ